MNWGSILVGTSLAGLLLASVPGKFGGAPPVGERAGRDQVEQRATDILRSQGFVPADTRTLSADGLYRVLSFRSPTCAGLLHLAAVPINGEAAEMLQSLPQDGERLFYIYDGKIWSEPPVWRAIFMRTWPRSSPP